MKSETGQQWIQRILYGKESVKTPKWMGWIAWKVENTKMNWQVFLWGSSANMCRQILTETFSEPLGLVIMLNRYCASVQEDQDDNLEDYDDDDYHDNDHDDEGDVVDESSNV